MGVLSMVKDTINWLRDQLILKLGKDTLPGPKVMEYLFHGDTVMSAIDPELKKTLLELGVKADFTDREMALMKISLGIYRDSLTA